MKTEKIKRKIIEEYKKIAFAKLDDVLGLEKDSIKIKDVGKIPKKTWGAIASIVRKKEGVVVKMYDKIKALEMLARHYGMSGEQNFDEPIIVTHYVPRGEKEEGER